MIHPALLSLPLLFASLPLPAKGTQDQTPPTPPPFEAPPDVAPDVEGDYIAVPKVLGEGGA